MSGIVGGINLRSSGLVNISSATDGQVFTGTGAGLPVGFEAAAGGAWGYISTAPASDSASLAFTNMVDGYDYLYTFYVLVPASNSVDLTCQLGVSGPTYRTSGYLSVVYGISAAGTSQSGEPTTAIFMNNDATNHGLGNVEASEGARSAELFLTNPANASTKTAAHGMMASINPSTLMQPTIFGSSYETAAEAHTSANFIMSSGNITSGSILQYRRARS